MLHILNREFRGRAAILNFSALFPHFSHVEVEIRGPSLMTRIRDAWTSWSERRRRVSTQVAPAPVEGRSFGYGSFSDVPTEFNPTLPPPPARSFAGLTQAEVNTATVANQSDERLDKFKSRLATNHPANPAEIPICSP